MNKKELEQKIKEMNHLSNKETDPQRKSVLMKTLQRMTETYISMEKKEKLTKVAETNGK